jgi:hypothetical protein
MTAKDVSVTELQKIIQDHVNAIPQVKEDHASVKVPRPQWNQPDDDGCNWHMGYLGDVRGYESEVGRIVGELRLEYNIKP